MKEEYEEREKDLREILQAARESKPLVEQQRALIESLRAENSDLFHRIYELQQEALRREVTQKMVDADAAVRDIEAVAQEVEAYVAQHAEQLCAPCEQARALAVVQEHLDEEARLIARLRAEQEQDAE